MIVLITGVTSGIGAATAVRFAKAGAKVILCGRRQEKLQHLAQTLQKDFQTTSYCLNFDVSQATQIDHALESLPTGWQDIDILINNAGLSSSWEKLPDGNIEDWDQVINTNIKGVLYMTKAILPRMIANGKGHIINLGSIAGHLAYPHGNVYCASKFAVRGLTDALRADVFDKNIRVTLISPGLVETEFSLVRFHGDATRAKAVYENLQPLVAEDVADAIFYASSVPAHVNINEITLTPVAQANSLLVHRDEKNIDKR